MKKEAKTTTKKADTAKKAEKKVAAKTKKTEVKTKAKTEVKKEVKKAPAKVSAKKETTTTSKKVSSATKAKATSTSTVEKKTSKKAVATKLETTKTEVKQTSKPSLVKEQSSTTPISVKSKEKSELKKDFNSGEKSNFAKYNRGYPNKFGRRKRFCKLCAKGVEHVDYKDVDLLYKYLTPNLKIASRKVTSSCSKHQTRVSNAIKRARIVALIPFIKD